MTKKAILGLQLGHNASAALIVEGKIIGAISEEKFDNVKNSSVFPLKSIRWLLEENKITSKDIQAVAMSGVFQNRSGLEFKKKKNSSSSAQKSNFKERLEYNLGKTSLLRGLIMNAHFYLMQKESNKAIPLLKKILKKEFKISSEKVHLVNHHEAHAYASYYSLCENLDEKALIITLDGAGDYECATISIVNQGNIKRVSATRWDHSIGYVYSKTTQFLGMKPLEHEYKVMGLAPYAKDYYLETYNKIFKNLITFSKDSLEFKSKIPLNKFNVHLEKFGMYERFDNIAAALQQFTEDITLNWIKAAVKKYGVKNIYFGGGVFMNVKLNMVIQELKEIEKVHFLGSCGDESNSIGACYYMYKKMNGLDEIKPLENFYLGLSYSNTDVKKFISQKRLSSKYEIQYYDDVEKEIAKLLSKRNVVARFKGKNEWGARALGNRSILAHPSYMESFFEVNDQIKMRDFWMPFAPSMLIEDGNKYIINPRNFKAPFMITGFNSTKEGQETIKAAMHQADKTLRPQLVEKEINIDYYKLISEFKKLTKIGSVMNTSFNLHGYPLVATLDQAMFTFENSGLKYLAIENYLIIKKQ